MIKIKPLNNSRLNEQLISLNGIRWKKDAEQWFLLIDESTVDPEELKQILPDNIFQTILTSFPMEINFKEIFTDICKKTKIAQNLYTIEADVISVYNIPNQQFFIAFLIDNHNTNQQLRIKIPNSLLSEDEQIIDKRIRITGSINLYSKHASFQLNATKLTILGECSRLIQLSNWATTYSYLFKSVQEQEELEFEFRRIGLISNEHIQGYTDFMKNLKKRTIETDDIIFSSITMTVKNITKSIEALNEEDCDCICIVRGGGNPEDLLCFSHPDLLHAITNSSIPVITGIAHKSDYLLCDMVADYNAGTPTGAAEFLNRLAGKIYYNNKKEQHIESSNYQKFLEQENARLTEENSHLLEELEKAHKYIAQKENRGIIRRIFNL